MTISIIDADIKAIIDTRRDTSPFIDTAFVVINELLASSGLSDARLTEIGKYLAAHFVAIAEASGAMRSKLGDAEEQYRLNSDKTVGFQVTWYGQTALALDTSGKLAGASANGGLKALFTVYAQRQGRNSWWAC